MNNSKIVYTKTDEAPLLATHSLLPIINSFVDKAGIEIETKNISLASRVLSAFPEFLKKNQRVNDALKELGDLVNSPDANIIKLPNISASIPQLISTIEELQSKGYSIPSYPISPSNKEESEIQLRYNKVKGSAVNPVLRQGNSDRRAPKAVKNYAKKNPHSMGDWSSLSKTHVSTMSHGDFFHNEKSICIDKETIVSIIFFPDDGSSINLKEKINLSEKEVIDASYMNKKSLLSFLKKEMDDAKESGIMLSLHLKATMMKVSDPIIFGHVVNTYFSDLILKHKQIFNNIGIEVRNGFGDVLEKINNLSEEKKIEIYKDIKKTFSKNAEWAMVDSENGITNLHVPSDIIIDASMPAMIRNSGKMWNRDGKIKDTKAIIPDSSYASIYKATIEFCKQNGAFNPSTMGTVPNVGLMAQKAEEYGSHDKTFEIPSDGTVKIIDLNGKTLIKHEVKEGDIWRMCQTKDTPIKDWVKLAVNRAKITGWPVVFWLDENRPHDSELIKKIKKQLDSYDTSKIKVNILEPYEATKYTLKRLHKGENTISVTGNVLRDYLTDLFPILELGTSAKMLSIVPLMYGGGLFETGAGGSAPKHVQQLIHEGHLRWDSLGEFLAIGVSLEHISKKYNNKKANVLSQTLNSAIEKLLINGKSPKRKVGQIDNRDSHFYLAMYWSEELAKQNLDVDLSSIFKILYEKLSNNKEKILLEIKNSQGESKNIKGYYFPDQKSIDSVMRPSKVLNEIIDNF